MFTLPDLPYAYDALDPYMSADIMRLHHDGHHKTYTDNLNKLIEGDDALAAMKIEDILKNLADLPEDKRVALRNQGGGYYNHALFWQNLSPKGGRPTGEVLDGIKDAFGDYETFQSKFTDGATKVFGSGWQWLVASDGKLELMATANQDSPLSLGKTPLLALDMWEHAYYLQYFSKRPDYIAAWWNIINWDDVAERLAAVHD
jgi:Fe-Mn family superoxide dismutase